MKLKFALAGLMAAAAAATASDAAAMPIVPMPHLAQVQEARWVCNPWGRCWWRPNYYGAYGYYPAPIVRFGGPRHFGWHRGWHRGWRRW
jgi:hypothetical protein